MSNIMQTFNKINDLINIIADIKDFLDETGNADRIPYKMKTDLKRTINKIFDEYTCRDVQISNNTDKEFFGMYIKYQFIGEYLFAEEKDHFSINDINYFIDIDSKLFASELRYDYIAYCIIYDIYNIVSKDAIMHVNYALDAIANGRNDILRKNTFESYNMMQQILKFAVVDYLHNDLSLFTRSTDDIIRMPDILEAYGVSEDVFDDIVNMITILSEKTFKPLINPALMLNWVVCVAKTYTPFCDDPMGVFSDYSSQTGSDMMRDWADSIFNRFYKCVAKQWNDIPKNIIKEASIFSGIRKSGMKNIENDLFEYEMRMKNIQDEDAAIFLMRQINSRMSVIAEYLDDDKISNNEMKKWQNLYDRYEKLRYKMVSKPVYAKKMYGLYTDYNALSKASPENYMTMNTFY